MCGIQNVTRKQGTYYYRRLIRLGPDKPFRLRMSLKTTSRKRAALRAPALTLICERVAMNMMVNIASDGLTGAQRAEIYRRQMLIERDRLEVMHANLHIIAPEDHDDLEDALALRLGASELAASDGIAKGTVEDFLVARTIPDDEDEPVVIMAWSDLAASIEQDGAEEAAVARLAEIGVVQSVLREVMACKVINQARIEAVREFRGVLANPGAGYAPVELAGYGSVTPQPSMAVVSAEPTKVGPYAMMTPSEAALKFFEHNPRTGGKDGASGKHDSEKWTNKTRNQFELPALLLEQVMDGRPLATVTHDDLVKLHQCFERLHGPSFRKSPKHRTMTIQEIVEETAERIRQDQKAAEQEARSKCAPDPAAQSKRITEKDLGLGVNTTNRHWGFLKQLTGWLGKHQPLAALDYSAFTRNDKRNQRDLRARYSDEQGRMLFMLPPWTGAKSAQKRMLAGDMIIHDAWYFVPMIAWYTGMRLDEIASLQLDEIECVDGYWQINVKWNDIRRLKTVSSTRSLPVSSQLQELGLIDYVLALRAAGEELLFPELRPESGIGTLGDAFYKIRWTHLAKKLPFLVKGQANHSFRHTAIDAMKAAGITLEVRKDFAGHVMSSETEGRYSKAHMALLREAVETIPKMTDHLDPVPINLLPARIRGPRKARKKKSAE